MKIIQSFAQFDDGAPRSYGDEEKNLLNFYSFLLSYLTINKYYGSVTMYCNKKAEETLIKYVPYDEVKIVENKNTTNFWSYYKVDIMKRMRQDFIHVDSDVFIFDDLFSEFINDKKYDLLIQNQIPKKLNYVVSYVEQFKDFVIENDIIQPEKYDGKCLSCGTLGMRIAHKSDYIKVCEAIKKEFIKRKTEDRWFVGMASEELALYLYSLKKDLKFHEILPYDDVLKHTEQKAGNYHNYTHMYLDSKFQPKYVKLIRNKIIKDFPEQIKYVQQYEDKVMKNTKILKEII